MYTEWLDNCDELLEKWLLDEKDLNKCRAKRLLLNSLIGFIVPFLAEIIFYIQNWEIAWNFFWFIVWWLFSLFFLLWYLIIQYMKYQDGSFLVWFVLSTILYVITFYIYFNFEWY